MIWRSLLWLSLFSSVSEITKVSSFANLPDLKSKDEVPVLFREPYIHSGFRALDQPWHYYPISCLFQLHNEWMNVWTHVIAAFLMASKLNEFTKEVDFLDDPHTLPLLAGLLCGIVLYCASSGAHCMQSKSEFVHYISFMIDYAGIGIYGLGSVIVHLHYCSHNDFYYATESFLVPLGSIFAFLICLCCTISKVYYKRPYPFARKLWQMIPVAGVYAVLISPIMHKFYRCFVTGDFCSDSISIHKAQIFWFMLSGLFFASHFPQKYLPGWFDVFGHNHSLFHISIMLSTLYQMDAVLLDYKDHNGMIMSRPSPTVLSSFGPVIIVMICEALCIYFMAKKVKRMLEKQE